MTITNKDLTDGNGLNVDADNIVTGNGVFDDIMESVNIHLDAQFKLGRIQAGDFAQVYLGSMQSAMSQAVQFLLGRDKISYEVDLIKAQIKLVEAQIKAQDVDRSANAAKAVAELNKNWGYPDAKLDNEGNVDAGEPGTNGLIDEQIVTENAKGLDVIDTTSIKNNQSDKDLEVKDAQIDKTNSEIELLDQKTISEVAQTEDAAKRGSVLGEQAELLKQQGKGFYWNAMNKWAKLTVDAASVDASQGGDAAVALQQSKDDRLAAKPNCSYDCD